MGHRDWHLSHLTLIWMLEENDIRYPLEIFGFSGVTNRQTENNTRLMGYNFIHLHIWLPLVVGKVSWLKKKHFWQQLSNFSEV